MFRFVTKRSKAGSSILLVILFPIVYNVNHGIDKYLKNIQNRFIVRGFLQK